MTVLGIDDTDSREHGMCTTFVGAEIASVIEDNGYEVTGTYLFRLNPAAQHKTRGNACVAIETTMPASDCTPIAMDVIHDLAVAEDERTHPGVVAADSVPDELYEYTLTTVRELVELETAVEYIESYGLESNHCGIGRGRIGALAALSVPSVLEDRDSTYEYISYRHRSECGTEREVNIDSVFEAANKWYPDVWDTVDRETGDAVCVPNAPGPILHGIRGDDKEAVQRVATEIESEPTERRQLFLTNQGTDMHLQKVNSLEELTENSAYIARGTVVQEPEFKQGGHVHFKISDGSCVVTCIAFEPTGRFRTNVVGNLITGDKVVVCGEVGRGNIKLEKLRVDRVRRYKPVTPFCDSCSVRMQSKGRSQGYQCKHCSNTAPGKTTTVIKRDIEEGWYEVPPCARRHISKPLVRGGFETETHPYS